MQRKWKFNVTVCSLVESSLPEDGQPITYHELYNRVAPALKVDPASAVLDSLRILISIGRVIWEWNGAENTYRIPKKGT